jgi:hypothetical protein
MDRFWGQGKCVGGVLAVAAAFVLAGPGRAQGTLTMNGQVVSTDVRTLGGGAYVRLGDMAKALGMVVVKRPGGYELTRAGGTDQVQALTRGKVGDVLFDGFWRFQVKSVETTDAYAVQKADASLSYDHTENIVHAKRGTKLVVIRCRMTNGQKSVQTFWLAPMRERPINNALTDTEGESYPPDGYDLDGSTSQSKPLLPGAKTDFVILFSVPEGTRLKELVFTLQNNDSRPGNDVRVSLR